MNSSALPFIEHAAPRRGRAEGRRMPRRTPQFAPSRTMLLTGRFLEYRPASSRTERQLAPGSYERRELPDPGDPAGYALRIQQVKSSTGPSRGSWTDRHWNSMKLTKCRDARSERRNDSPELERLFLTRSRRSFIKWLARRGRPSHGPLPRSSSGCGGWTPWEYAQGRGGEAAVKSRRSRARAAAPLSRGATILAAWRSGGYSQASAPHLIRCCRTAVCSSKTRRPTPRIPPTCRCLSGRVLGRRERCSSTNVKRGRDGGSSRASTDHGIWRRTRSSTARRRRRPQVARAFPCTVIAAPVETSRLFAKRRWPVDKDATRH